jgi:hypothetical protein
MEERKKIWVKGKEKGIVGNLGNTTKKCVLVHFGFH